MKADDLTLFREAQAPIIERAAAELAAGRKQTHWMWFVLPQLAGLGRSATALRFGLRDLDHARRYLADPVLGESLRACVGLTHHHDDVSARELLGTPDDLKYRSCLTLFLRAASREDDRALFRSALDRYYGGGEDPATLRLLDLAERPPAS